MGAAVLAQMMDGSSQFALGASDQLKNAGEPKQDRQQYSRLEPVKQQVNRFKPHLRLLALLGTGRARGWILIKCLSVPRPGRRQE
jgi:hypothetical protein